MAMMRCKPVISSLAFASFLMGGAAPVAMASSSDDAQIRALRLEMAQMRKEMMGQITTLKSRLAKTENISRRQDRVSTASAHGGRATSHHEIASGPVDPSVQFNEPAASSTRIHLANSGTPTSDRGDVMSWKSFRAATKSDENVHVGGMIVGFPKGRFTVASEDGAYGLSIGLAFHEDFGGFFNSGPRAGEGRGAFNSFTTNMRRLRIPFTFRYKNWVAAVTPDFGANHNDGYVGLYEGNLNYTGLHNTILTVGYFQPRVTEEDSESSNDFFTLERPSITDMVRNIAAGDARFSVGGLHYEKRWWIAGYFTGQEWGHRNASDMSSTYYGGGSGTTMDSQTGATLRVAGRPVATKDWDVHMGASGISAFRLACNSTSATSCSRSTSFGQRPEFDIGEANLAATGGISNAAQVWAAGPELGVRWKRLIVKGEYYHVGVQRDAPGLKSAGFQGWYGSAAYTLFGNPRLYNEKEGAFGAPGVPEAEEFDPARNHWGALEVVGHYSVIDLNSRLNDANAKNVIRGGQQTVWTGGLNWYPNRHFRLMLDYSHFIVSRSEQATNIYGRTGNSVAARIQAGF
ncbi:MULTISPECIES: OprO/OprP family phosphate-selective porin [Acetobacter]|uniref:Porin n=1 Tax=Acetobacter cerevisiae TaxID=178900 RepID=A0A149UV27_9PROT|nr:MULTISPECIES: porin [Acetobacter]KXU97017.1 porin [Acetobacter cerevisiae]KXV71799.1 porin [Acetobacter cerevisiae]KXV78419.1 porin [Acetobacter cerevisiae]MCP1245176.1 OprO/OprP family phosphate-selective porin [Acetobacter cerevisiae]MCP1254597.1 OprO/OprP family phosphate-selective porin [Acetobacter cerevisiae]